MTDANVVNKQDLIIPKRWKPFYVTSEHGRCGYSVITSKTQDCGFTIHGRKPEGATRESKTSDMECNGETDNNIFVLFWSVIEERSLFVETLSPAAGFVYTVFHLIEDIFSV